MENVRNVRRLSVFLSFLIVLCGLFLMTPTAHAKEAVIQPASLSIVATTPDENIIYPTTMTVEYSKFSDLGLTITEDDPGIITPLHALAAYYKKQGADKATMSQYITVEPDGTLKALKGSGGLTAVKDTTRWMISTNGSAVTDSETKEPVISITTVNIGNLSGRGTLGFYAYDTAETDAFINYQNSNEMVAVGGNYYNYFNRTFQLKSDGIAAADLSRAVTPIVYKIVDGKTEIATMGDENADYQLTSKKDSPNESFVFNKPGVYYVSAETSVVADGQKLGSITRPLEKVTVYSEEEYNFHTDVNSTNFYSGKLTFYEQENLWKGSTYSPIYMGRNGSSVEWKSSDPSRLKLEKSEDGLDMNIIPNFDHLKEDAKVTVTATISLGDFKEEKKFECTVVANTDLYCVQKDYESAGRMLNNYTFKTTTTMGTSNLCKGAYGSDYEFTSSKPDNIQFKAISEKSLQATVKNDDIIEDTPVTTYIKITKGKESMMKELPGTLLATCKLKSMTVEGIDNFQFDETKSTYDFEFEKDQEINLTISGVPKANSDKLVMTINGQEVQPGQAVNVKVDTTQEKVTVPINVSRSDQSRYSGGANLVFRQIIQATPEPDYTAFWGTAHRNDYNTRVVENAFTPRTASEMNIEGSWNYAISTTGGSGMSGWGKWSYPIVVNDNIYVAADSKIRKFDMDGNLLIEAPMSGGVLGGGYTGWLAYGEGKIFVPSGSNIMAFNAEDLTQVWSSSSGVSGSQGSCPILYHDGYVYSGTTNANGAGGYYCFKAEDENKNRRDEVKSPIWTLTDLEGSSSFYWAGAAIVKDYLYVPCDNGNVYAIDLKASVEKKEAVIKDKINVDDQVVNIRTSIAYDETNKSIYYPTYSNNTYKVKLNDNGTFNKNEIKSIAISSQCPTVYNGRLYLANSVVDAETMELIYTAPVEDGAYGGGVNGSTMITTYATEANSQTVYIYGHSNSNPDKICVFKDSQANNADNPGSVKLLWTNEAKPQYATSNLVVAQDGSLVFVNDSANLFCVKSNMTKEKLEYERSPEGVMAKIEALPEAERINLQDKAAIEDARSAYEELSKEDKEKITNYSKLQACEARLAELKETADRAAAQAVTDQIASLPEVKYLTYDDHKEAVESAKVAYDALTKDQKVYVMESDVKKLNECVDKMRTLKPVAGYVNFDVERFTIGQGFYLEPVKVPFYEGDNGTTIIKRAIGEENFIGTTSGGFGTYMEGIKGADLGSQYVNIPAYIPQILGGPSTTEARETGNTAADNALSQYAYCGDSGWMYFVNNEEKSVGIDGYTPKDGDTMRLMFTLYGTGADLRGYSYTDPENRVEIANKDELITLIAAVNAGENPYIAEETRTAANGKEELLQDEGIKKAYKRAVDAIENMTLTQAATDQVASDLTKALSGDTSWQAAVKAAEKVQASIGDCKDYESIRLSDADKKAVTDARTAYNALSDSEQRSVLNYSSLGAAEKQLARLEEAHKALSDQIAAADTEQSGSYTESALQNLRDAIAVAKAVDPAKASADEMSTAAAVLKNVVASLSKNTAADKTALLSAVNDAQALLNAPAVPESFTEVLEKAETLLNDKELSSRDQQQVDAAVLALQAEIDSLKQTIAADREAANAVTVKIISLPAANQLRLEDKADLEAAKEAYKQLTDDQKTYISKENTQKLEDLSVRMAELDQAATDQEQADAMMALIDKLPSVEALTLADRGQIQATRNAYATLLTDDQKALVTNLDKLTEAEAQIKALEAQEEADKEAAEAVIEKIKILGEITLDKAHAVQEAREAYSSLSEAQKRRIDNETYGLLVKAEAEITRLTTEAQDQATAKAVQEQIAALPANDRLTLNDKEAVNKAREAYNALTPGQKGYVTNLDVLKAAESKILKLEEEPAPEPTPDPTPKLTPQPVTPGGEGSGGSTDPGSPSQNNRITDRAGSNTNTGIVNESSVALWGGIALIAAVAGLTGAAVIRKRRKS